MNHLNIFKWIEYVQREEACSDESKDSELHVCSYISTTEAQNERKGKLRGFRHCLTASTQEAWLLMHIYQPSNILLDFNFCNFYYLITWYFWVDHIKLTLWKVDSVRVDLLTVDLMQSRSGKNWSRGSWSHESWSRVLPPYCLHVRAVYLFVHSVGD